ncbi:MULTISPECIES: aromatic acid exporter family protein [unclassified Agreia]|uniref:FUSC family protein n=1 Tax=unclassified Agreia TaxID=2641148 RepID=UPI001F342ABB|nr:MULTISPECIES: aromatic acid exporter family protein [unclassified Agreia]
MTRPPAESPRRGAFARRMVEAGLAPARYARVLQSDDRAPLLQIVKTGVAASLAWIVCLAILPAQLPVFGAIAAIIVVQPSVNQSFAKALERTVGVIVGVVIAYLVGLVFGQSTWIVLLSIVLALLTGWALRLSQSTTVQLPISAMLVLTIGAQTPGYAGGRIIETALGALVAVAVNLVVVPPVRLQPAHDAVAALGKETAACLDGLAQLLVEPSTAAQRNQALVEVRLLAPMLAKARAAVTSAEESLRFNPRRRTNSEALELDDDLLAMLGVIVGRVPGMVRGLADNYDESLHTESTVTGLADEMTRAAHDLRLVMQDSDLDGDEPEPLTSEVPALTAPLRVITPSPTHWILIGSLIEDLRRVHEVIVEAGRSVRP